MKPFFTILLILLFNFLSPNGIAQETTNTTELIELEGEEGRILVFPSPVPGPDGPIIKFVVFGVYETPEVVIDTMNESLSPQITTIHFSKGKRFSGWFDVPKERIISIWINGWFIPWEEMK